MSRCDKCRFYSCRAHGVKGALCVDQHGLMLAGMKYSFIFYIANISSSRSGEVIIPIFLMSEIALTDNSTYVLHFALFPRAPNQPYWKTWICNASSIADPDREHIGHVVRISVSGYRG